MTFHVKFSEQGGSFRARFGAVQTASDGGYERGYAAGYENGQESVQAEYNAILDRTISGEYINSSITTLGGNAFYGCNKLTKITMPNLTTTGAAAFQVCTALKELVLPSLIQATNDLSSYNTALTNVSIPLCTYLGANAFRRCAALERIELPSVATMREYVFYDCSKLSVVIVRTPSVCAMSQSSVFTNTPIAKGTGYIYVPAALVEQYKTATNWSTYAAQIRAIEDYPEITGG